MKALFSTITISTILLSNSLANTALAVQPTALSQHDRGPWSQVINDPFDGLIVYDKDFYSDSAMITTWSMREIRATKVQTVTVGYRQVPRYDWHDDKRRRYYDTEPITENLTISPIELKFAINGKVYTYLDGEVASDLAQALATAYTSNVAIRAVWPDRTFSSLRIGPQTLAAWKIIFKP